MKDLQDWAAVQRVYKQTGSIRETARILSMARNTVRRLVKMNQAPEYRRAVYPSVLDAYKEQILDWMIEPYCFNGTRIFRELKKRGYKGSIGPIYYYLRRINEDIDGHISSKATVRIETPPGDQAQFDWSEYQISIGGVYRTVYCFAMILAASRKKAVCFSLKSDADAIYEAIQELFEDLGGVTLELLIDNPKALVIENSPKSEEEIRYNPEALLLARHLGTELNACPCYWPRKKGKIERPFNYIEQQFVKGNTFTTMEELNRRGKQFVNEWCSETHGTTLRIPNEHYLQEEKTILRELPKTRFMTHQLSSRKVSPDSFVHINTNKYSVPVRYVDKTVFFRLVYGFRIEIYDRDGEKILALEQQSGKNGVYSNPEHYEPIARNVSTSIPQIRRDFTSRFSNGSRYLEAASRKFDQPTHHARRIMELQELYADDILDRFIGAAVSEDKMDITSFRAMLREYNDGIRKLPGKPAEQPPTEPPAITAEADDALVRDCSYYEEYVGKENSHNADSRTV